MNSLITGKAGTVPIKGLVIGLILLIVLGAVLLATQMNGRQGVLFIVGVALGVVLYHAAFGFTAAWRVFITERRGRGLRAQMVMLALTVLLFFPALGSGSLMGHPVAGLVSPVGISMVFGAFIFGLGMQLGGGCASGTLYTVGGGNVKMLVTLVFFIIGSVLATVHFDSWAALPHIAPVSLVSTVGPLWGIVISLVIFAFIYWSSAILERRRHGALEQSSDSERHGISRFLQGPWPLLAGALALAVLNFITLYFSGRPWGITSAFALWGAKVAQLIGFDPAQWAYWQTPANAKALSSSIWADVTSVMDIGIILGAMLASAFAGRFAPSLRIAPRALLAAVIGGLLLGYGARLAYGCNIGAYFSGISSGSLHGWVWIVVAFFGNALGVKLRPWFYSQR